MTTAKKNRDIAVRYAEALLKHRWAILLLTLALTLAALSLPKPRLMSSDATIWVEKSREFEKNRSDGVRAKVLLRLAVPFDSGRIDDEAFRKLKRLHDILAARPEVEGIRSLLDVESASQRGPNAEERMLELTRPGSAKALKKAMRKDPAAFAPYFDATGRETYLYVTLPDAGAETSFERFVEKELKTGTGSSGEKLLFATGLLLVTLILGLLFRSWIPVAVALASGGLSLLLTLALSRLLFGVKEAHIAVILLTLAIVLMDMLYFYYRWHVSQWKNDSAASVVKAIERNIVPAFWTSVVTAAGLGSLLFIDLPVLRHIGAFALLGSFIGFLVSVTFVPALLSFFSIRNAKVPFDRFSHWLADNEIHHEPKYLRLFAAATVGALLVALLFHHLRMLPVVEPSQEDRTLVLSMPLEELTPDTYRALRRFEGALEKRFSGSIEKIESVDAAVRKILETEKSPADEIHLGNALFYLDLFQASDLYDGSRGYIRIYLKPEARKSDLIRWIRSHPYASTHLRFVDLSSLVYAAKMDDIRILGLSILTALLIIGLVLYLLSKKIVLFFISVAVNAVPLVWFAFFMTLLGIPVSIELLIAATITLGLASDATIHFSYKYIQGRNVQCYDRRTTLEKIFFYYGIPVLIVNGMLALFFAILSFYPLSTLSHVGLDAALLILISLAVDIFLLPVLLLYVDGKRGDVSAARRSSSSGSSATEPMR
ncbi:MMPL family transporter [Hydrogenimonas sp. SS33]|uniref:MMPL family transporter n=1 Tax=Hydrogenimonas leucolamina TaxID=2954236 RepID=UPI00336C0A8B